MPGLVSPVSPDLPRYRSYKPHDATLFLPIQSYCIQGLPVHEASVIRVLTRSLLQQAALAQLRLSRQPTKPAMSGYYYHPQSFGQPPQQPQPAVFRPTKPEDWEPYHDIIAHLYNTMNMKLKDVMTEMQVSYNFKAT